MNKDCISVCACECVLAIYVPTWPDIFCAAIKTAEKRSSKRERRLERIEEDVDNKEH